MSEETNVPLRIGAVFIIMVAATLGVFPPVLLRPSQKTMAGIPFSCAKVLISIYHVDLTP